MHNIRSILISLIIIIRKKGSLMNNKIAEVNGAIKIYLFFSGNLLAKRKMKFFYYG